MTVTQALEDMDQRASVRDGQQDQLVQVITSVLAHLRNQVLRDQEFILHGLHTYMEWLPRALDSHGIQYEHKPGRRKRTGSLMLVREGWALEMYNTLVEGNTSNGDSGINRRGSTTDYLGNMVTLRLRRIITHMGDDQCELEVRWLAADIATSDRGMSNYEVRHGGWVFPPPVYRYLVGEPEPAGAWLTQMQQVVGL